MKTKDVLYFVFVTILSFFFFVLVNKVIKKSTMIYHDFFVKKYFIIDTMKINSSYKKYFVYKNKSSKVISIRNITKDCSCSEVNYIKSKKIQPKRGDSILITIKPTETGYYQKSFYIYYTDSSIPDTLTVSGYVVE